MCLSGLLQQQVHFWKTDRPQLSAARGTGSRSAQELPRSLQGPGPESPLPVSQKSPSATLFPIREADRLSEDCHRVIINIFYFVEQKILKNFSPLPEHLQQGSRDCGRRWERWDNGWYWEPRIGDFANLVTGPHFVCPQRNFSSAGFYKATLLQPVANQLCLPKFDGTSRSSWA